MVQEIGTNGPLENHIGDRWVNVMEKNEEVSIMDREWDKGSRLQSDRKETQRDFISDIEKLKNAKNKDGEAAQEAKKLRGEIEQQMEKSFELIEEKQNEVKDFLRQREKEEEEHKQRAADIVSRLENGMIDFDDDIDKKIRKTRSYSRGEKEVEIDSKSVQTDCNPLISKDVQTEEFKNSVSQIAGKGKWKNQEINIDDIPEVIEAIKDNLVESIKTKLANKDEIVEETEGGEETQPMDGGKATQMAEHCKEGEDGSVPTFNKKSIELAKAVVENEIQRENEAKNQGKSGESINEYGSPTFSRPTDVLSDHRKQLEQGLLCKQPNIHEVAGISSEGKEKLEDAFDRMRKDFDNLAELMTKDNKATAPENIGNARLNRCRDLCRDIDSIESVIDGIDDDITAHMRVNGIEQGLTTDASDCINYDSEERNGSTAGPLVAQLSDDNEIVNSVYAHMQIPVETGGNRQLAELLERKMDADKKLNSKLGDLKRILGQEEDLTQAEMQASEKQIKTVGAKKLPDDDGQLPVGKIRLLQRELDDTYRENEKLMEENAKLRNELQDEKASKKSKLDEIFDGNESNDFDVSRWESEKDIRRKLDEIKQRIGDNMFDDLLADRGKDAVQSDALSDYHLIALENRNLENLLQEYKDDIEKLEKRLISADVTNDINGMIKIDNGNKNKVIEELQREAAKTDEIIGENQEILMGKEQVLNETVLKRSHEVNEEARLMEDKCALERELVATNNAIHEFFPAKDREKKHRDLQRRMKEIDENIEAIAREIDENLEENEAEKWADVRKLERLLEKLTPHVKQYKKMKLRSTINGKFDEIPEETEVDEAIQRKLGLEDYIMDKNHEGERERETKVNGDEEVKETRKANGIFIPKDDLTSDMEELERLKKELKTVDENLKEKEMGTYHIDDLREVKESLKSSIDDTKKDIEDARITSEKAKSHSEELEKTEQKIEALKTILSEVEKEREGGDEEELENEQLVTRINVKEKIDETCKSLKQEKERTQLIIESTENLEKERSKSSISDNRRFLAHLNASIARIATDVEECLDDAERIISSASHTLQTANMEDSEGREIEELVKKKDRLTQLSDAITQLNGDLEMITKFEKVGETGEISDSDIEELVYKMEAITVSIERMDKTIDEHVRSDGDPKTLETLMKRKEKMKESRDEVKKDIDKRKEMIGRDLQESLNGRSRVEAEIRSILGDGVIESDTERLAMLEVIGYKRANDQLESGLNDGELTKCLIQWQKIAEDYEDFLNLRGLTEDDSEFLTTMIDNVELDIIDRLEEIQAACKGFHDDLAYEKAYLNNMVKSRSDLQGAVKILKMLSDEGKKLRQEDGTGLREEGYVDANSKLRSLAEKKMHSIDEKLNRLENIVNRPAFKSNFERLEQNLEAAVAGNEAEKGEELIEEVKGELKSLQLIDRKEEDWSGITASLMEEIETKIDIDEQVNKLFDEREEYIDNYVTSLGNRNEENDGKHIKDRIEMVDQRILEHSKVYLDERSTAQSSQTLTEGGNELFGEDDENANSLKPLLDKRDFAVRQLFALRTRESGRKYGKPEMKIAQDVSSLKPTLEERLNFLDSIIVGFNRDSSASPMDRTQSPNLYAMMKMIEDEIEMLKEEVDENKLFLSGKKGNVDEGREEDSDADEPAREDQDEIIEQMQALQEKRDQLILEAVEDGEMDEEDLIEKRNGLESALKEVQGKLVELEKKEQIERKIEELERKVMATRLENDMEETTQIMEKERAKNDLSHAEDLIAKYAIAIEKELGRVGEIDLRSRETAALNKEDQQVVRNLLKDKLNELVKERMELDSPEEYLSKQVEDAHQLQELVNRRKDIMNKIADVANEFSARCNDRAQAKELYEQRQDYDGSKQKMNFLQMKKEEIQNLLANLEPQKEASFEDTTSGFSESVELDERSSDVASNRDEEMSELKRELERVKEVSKKSRSDLDEEKSKVNDLLTENGVKDEIIERLEDEVSRLQKEIAELNDAAEAMMEVANAMDEQNQAKSLEIELNQDHIRKLERQLKEATSKDWHGMEANFDALEKKLKEKSEEVDGIQSEKADMNSELERLRERVKLLQEDLNHEKSRCLEMAEQEGLLDQLKSELQRKGKRILRIEKDELLTASPTDEYASTDGRESNDFKNEIDKVSAVEEIMKLAAEMKSENERISSDCRDLERQKDELTGILEELLDKCQVQAEEIQKLEQKLAESEGKKEKSIISKQAKQEDEIFATENRILMEKPTFNAEDEFDNLTTRITILSNEKEQLRDETEEAKMRVNDLESDLKEKEEMLKSAENQIEELMGTARSLFAKNDKLEERCLREEELWKKKEQVIKGELLKKDEQAKNERNAASDERKRADDVELEKQKLEHELLMKSTKNDLISKQLEDLGKEREDLLEELLGGKRKLENRHKAVLQEKEDLADRFRLKCNELAALKSESDIKKMNYEQGESRRGKEAKKLMMALEEANDTYDELQNNFDRMKKAKEKMMLDYEKQIKGLADEANVIRGIETRLQEKLKSKEADVINMAKKLESDKEELAVMHKMELEGIIKDGSRDLMNEISKRREAETQMESLMNELKNAKQKLLGEDKERKAEVEIFNAKIDALRFELQKRDSKIRNLQSIEKDFDDAGKRSIGEWEVRRLNKQFEEEMMKMKEDLENRNNEKGILLEKLQKMKESLKEKEVEIENIEMKYQNEVKEMRQQVVEKEFKTEKEKFMEKMKDVEAENSLMKYKRESLERSACISKLNEEKFKLKEDLKELGEMVRLAEKKHSNEMRSRDLRIDELETANQGLERKLKNVQEKLVREMEEGRRNRSTENECMRLKSDIMLYKEKLIDMNASKGYKEKAEKAEKELLNAREDFEKLKNESIQILKHSTLTKNELKKIRQQISEVKREHKNEQKLLIANLENEFRNKLEEIIKSNLEEKEKLLQMWNDEREDWESEMTEDMQNSKHESQRQLRLQRADLERESMEKLAEVIKENKNVVNDLNARLSELENERLRMELKFNEEIRAAENQFVAEKEYMSMMIRELLKNLVDSKSRKNRMNENYKNEIMDMEEKFEKEKIYMDSRVKEELKLIRERVNKLLSREVIMGDRRTDDFLDLIPRKL